MRAAVGDIPIVATFDLHGNEDGEFLEVADGTFTVTVEATGYVPQTIAGVANTWGVENVLDYENAVSHLFHKVLHPGFCIYACKERVFGECQALPKYTDQPQLPGRLGEVATTRDDHQRELEHLIAFFVSGVARCKHHHRWRGARRSRSPYRTAGGLSPIAVTLFEEPPNLLGSHPPKRIPALRISHSGVRHLRAPGHPVRVYACFSLSTAAACVMRWIFFTATSSSLTHRLAKHPNPQSGFKNICSGL